MDSTQELVSGKESRNVVNLFGIPVQVVTMGDVLDDVHAAILQRTPFDIGVVNAAKVVNMQKDRELFEAVVGSDAIYADGMSVVWASRILGKPLPSRIAGIDLMHEIMNLAHSNHNKVFCLGATQEVLNNVCEKFRCRYPGAEIVGSHNGYFDSNEESEIAEMIRNSNADVLFVAITSPKKERFIAKWTKIMNVPVVHGVGGSFDVVAGVARRAPVLLQKLGLEWLYRLLQEPRRLAGRYTVTNALFIMMVAREYARSFSFLGAKNGR